MFFSFLFVGLGVFFLFFYNVYYISLLLGLELILLSVYLYLWVGGSVMVGFTGVVLFLLVVVCMGALGVSLLVSLFREWGGDRGASFFVF